MLPHDDANENERVGRLLNEIGEENAIAAATALLGAVFHGLDEYTRQMRGAELTSRLIAVSIHPDGGFCPGVLGPLLQAAATAMAVVYEGLGMATDPNGETVTPRYIAEALARNLAAGDEHWPMMQGQAAAVRAALGFTDDADEDDDDEDDAGAFSERYRALSDGSDDAAEDAAVLRDRESIDALNALLGLRGPE